MSSIDCDNLDFSPCCVTGLWGPEGSFYWCTVEKAEGGWEDHLLEPKEQPSV